MAMAVRGFAQPIAVNMIDSDFNPPSSQKPLYHNQFEHKANPKEFADPTTTAKPPVVHDPKDLIPAHAGDPHNTYGLGAYSYVHYDITREPTFPNKPDLSAGELAQGANLVRTDVWHTPGEPAISSIARFAPENFRAVGYAQNAPTPEGIVPEGHLDFRHNRLNTDHADRRPFLYFLSAGVGFAGASLIRFIVVKSVHTLWPSKDVFAAGVVEVDIRPVREGQNFVVKWRGKPVFIRRRTPEMIEAARKDDVLIASFRDPQTDDDRVTNPEWLIILGVCTHLGCIPFPDQGDWGGYFCPCHGSHYDHSGRIRKGPAPANMEVPPNQFIDEFTVKLG